MYTSTKDTVNLLDCLQDDVTLVNDRLSHTVYSVTVSAETVTFDPDAVIITLRAEYPAHFEMRMRCSDPACAVQALWQACAIALFCFSFEAFPAPPWERS